MWTTDPTVGPDVVDYVIGTPASARAVIRDANAPVNEPPSVRIAAPRDGWVFRNPPGSISSLRRRTRMAGWRASSSLPAT